MKFFTRAVDRFCVKHPRFGVNNLILYIVIANAVVYIFSMMDRTGTFISYLRFMPSRIFAGEVWRIVTFIFIPEGADSNILFVALFLYFYYFIGTNLEETWGSAKFTIYYLSGVLITVIYGFIVWIITGSSIISGYISAHYLNLSMFLAFATLYPNTQVLLFFIIPIKVKWLAIIDALYFLLIFVSYPFPLNFLPFIAVLNYFLFCGDSLTGILQPLRYHLHLRRGNTKPSARKPKKSGSGPAYSHKCSVCGRTDADNPNLEFRYCSRCVGYHCFCEDHINSHIHFRE